MSREDGFNEKKKKIEFDEADFWLVDAVDHDWQDRDLQFGSRCPFPDWDDPTEKY